MGLPQPLAAGDDQPVEDGPHRADTPSMATMAGEMPRWSARKVASSEMPSARAKMTANCMPMQRFHRRLRQRLAVGGSLSSVLVLAASRGEMRLSMID